MADAAARVGPHPSTWSRPTCAASASSDAPAGGYDKKTVAADLHGLLDQLGLVGDLRLVGHDLGTMVAYAYAAAHPQRVSRLVLTEAPIPDESIYTFPALTSAGPGVWNFGFFNLANGLPEELVSGPGGALGGPVHRRADGAQGQHRPRPTSRSTPGT